MNRPMSSYSSKKVTIVTSSPRISKSKDKLDKNFVAVAPDKITAIYKRRLQNQYDQGEKMLNFGKTSSKPNSKKSSSSRCNKS